MSHADLLLTVTVHFGYPAVAAGCFVKAFSMLVAAGVLAQQGYLDPFPALIWAWLGTLAGDEAEFGLGRRCGPSLLNRLPRRVRTARRLERVREFGRRYDTWFVVGFRFVYGIRLATPLALGMGGMAHRRFFLLNAFGSLAWCALCLWSGYGLGGFAGRWYASLKSRPALVAALTVVLILALTFALRRLRRRGAP